MIDGATYHWLESKGYHVTRVYLIDCKKCGEAVNPDEDHGRFFLSDAKDEIEEHERVYHS